MVRSAVLVLHIGLDGGDRPLELSIAVSLLLLDDCFGDQFGHDVSSEQRDPTVNPKS